MTDVEKRQVRADRRCGGCWALARERIKDAKSILDVCTRGEVHVFAVHVKAHTEVVLRLIDVEVPGVLRRDGKCEIFRNDGGIIADERRWDIALWSKAWAGSLMRSDVAIFWQCLEGEYSPMSVDFLIVDLISPPVLRS